MQNPVNFQAELVHGLRIEGPAFYRYATAERLIGCGAGDPQFGRRQIDGGRPTAVVKNLTTEFHRFAGDGELGQRIVGKGWVDQILRHPQIDPVGQHTLVGIVGKRKFLPKKPPPNGRDVDLTRAVKGAGQSGGALIGISTRPGPTTTQKPALMRSASRTIISRTRLSIGTWFRTGASTGPI